MRRDAPAAPRHTRAPPPFAARASPPPRLQLAGRPPRRAGRGRASSPARGAGGGALPRAVSEPPRSPRPSRLRAPRCRRRSTPRAGRAPRGRPPRAWRRPPGAARRPGRRRGRPTGGHRACGPVATPRRRAPRRPRGRDRVPRTGFGSVRRTAAAPRIRRCARPARTTPQGDARSPGPRARSWRGSRRWSPRARARSDRRPRPAARARARSRAILSFK